MKFSLEAPFKPAGGQQQAINEIVKHYPNSKRQTLLGITGSGKTFVMANVIERIQKPTLIIAHNKTLAAQLYGELKEMFPKNRVEYFVSYYDYYQPESYLPTSDTYIEKDATVNEQIERMRLQTVSSLLSRDDVIVVASISCIYGLSNPKDFLSLSLNLKVGDQVTREAIIHKLIAMQFERNRDIVEPGKFRVRGDVIDIVPIYEKNSIRLEFFGSEIESISEIDHITGEKVTDLTQVKIFPAKQFVVPEEKHKKALQQIESDLKSWLPKLELLEATRLEKRVKYDLEMIKELGYCSGIENYSRYFDERKEGEPPYVLLDYFPKDFLLIIDESHQTIPQSHGMYKGDYSRKKNLVDFGFRLPAAFDNRPLKFKEFEKYFNHTVFVSATPGDYEIDTSQHLTELIIRPTGLLDPEIEVKPIKGYIKDLMGEIKRVVDNKERVLITTLTKRMAEDLTDYLSKENIKVRYLHSDIDSLDRIELIRQLRLGEFDVLVGINLLREGLDIPEVSLVCVLDADKEGFLRNERSLIQTIGRAARNMNGKVILYADHITDSIRRAASKTKKRRETQIMFNEKHGITPQTIKKTVKESTRKVKGFKHLSKTDMKRKIIELEAKMKRAAEELNFEKAIEYRNAYLEMKKETGNAT